MRIQLLSDLHLETESFEPEPNPAAELLVLGGDIDSRWAALQRFRGWPVPVLMVAGNHEFDGRELDDAWLALRARCGQLGITLLERESLVRADADGARIRFVATVRWCDFDLFGDTGRATAMRAAAYYMRIMRSTRRGVAFDPEGVREEALACRDWLAAELAKTGDWDRTVALTHFAPSLRSADPRYGAQPGTASFCNADDALLPFATTWIHGHLHCRHDYLVEHAGGRTRVICNARGHGRKGEAEGHDPLRLYEV
ncbi:metallophosphoesterase [Variovorax sp. YR752]|uniref:metallophosphoesterase n=1 Tax=Variovorax sp. YR752 TaxID=1884383 RepID=UPI003137B348